MGPTREEYRRFHHKRRRALLELLSKHVPEKVDRCLDIGGGGDVFGLAEILRERFAGELFAVDQGDDVARGAAHGIHTTACNVDNEPLPYEVGSIDLILFASVIEHLYNPHHVIGEIARVLRPAGVLVVEAPNAVSFGRRLDALFGRNPFRWFNEYNALENKAFMVNCSVFYTAEEVGSLLSPRFDLLERRFAMHNPPVNPVKAALRAVIARAMPRASDCFFVVARRRAD